MEDKKMTKEELLNLVGDFTWDFGSNFFIETEVGNFAWSDPEYGGDNSIVKIGVDLKTWLGSIPYGRDKGRHRIGDYCGENITWSDINDKD